MSTSAAELDDGISLLTKLGDRYLQLKPDVQIYPQADSVDKYVVADSKAQQFFYCDADAFALLTALNGQLTLNQAIKSLEIDERNDHLLETLLVKFIKHGLLSGFNSPAKKQRWWKSFKQPIAMKFPLFNPDSLLNSLSRFSSVIFSKYCVFLFLALLTYSFYQLPLQWGEIQNHWQSRFFDPMNGLLLALAYVFLKSLHELGHGLAVKKYGGVVRECGVFMLVFIPLPYVDTSASYIFPKRKQRMVVGAAGMWVELIIAMFAFILWKHSGLGYWSDFLFNIVFVGSFSTLIFNLNPLMRFDGYYILSDWLGVFNLNTRSRALLGGAIKRKIFRSEKTHQEGSLPIAKHGFLIFYALCALPYRLFIGLVIAFYLSGKFFVFGTLLALWVLFQMLMWPAIKHVTALYQEAIVLNQLQRFSVLMLGSTCLLFSLLFLINFNFSDSQVAMTIAPQEQKISSMADGVVTSVEYQSGDRVKKGTILARLESPELELKHNIAVAVLDEFKAEYRLLGLSNIAQAQSWQEKIAIQQREVNQLKGRIDSLELKAPIDGEFVLARERDVVGSYLERGAVFAKVFKPSSVNVLVIVSEEQVRKLSFGVDSIEVRFNTNPSETYQGSIVRIRPAAESELPSRFMGSSAGGMVAVDSRDQAGLKAVSPFFLVEVSVEKENNDFMPAMTMVRFVYKQMSVVDYFLADIYYRYTQKLH